MNNNRKYRMYQQFIEIFWKFVLLWNFVKKKKNPQILYIIDKEFI